MFILASQSPRRKQLMGEDISQNFEIIVSHSEEKYPDSLTSPIEIVKFIGRQKGEEIHKLHINDIVISADTIVVLDNEIIGKPKDANDAILMLKKLSGRTHIVYTGYTVFYKDKAITNCVKSEVLFNELSDQLIRDYVATGSPLDKAGAYGVQDNEKFPIVKQIFGSVKNVIGFPTDEIKIDIENIQK